MKIIESDNDLLDENEKTKDIDYKFDNDVKFDISELLDIDISEESEATEESKKNEDGTNETASFEEKDKEEEAETAAPVSDTAEPESIHEEKGKQALVAPDVEKEKRILKKRRKKAKFLCAFLSIVLVFIGVGYGFVNSMLDKIGEDETNRPGVDPEQVDVIYDEEDYELYSAIKGAGSLNNYVYQWYNWDGGIMQSKNVINVLLLGLDDRNALEKGGRSDVMMLASLNTKTKKIHLVSFYRDSWVYFVTPDGKEHTGKINGAYFYGGAEGAVNAIEKNFKIKIDHYVTVDFNSFQDIVNAVGGVRVDVQQYEANNMMREWKIECPVGEKVLLNGKQAFYFARQRHSDADADVSRTRRQRQVITAFIDSCKGASTAQLSTALNKVFGFVKTDLTKNEIMGYATRALVNGWLNYDIEQVVLSDPSIFQTPTINKVSIVVMDYPKVANIVQTELYGFSNVVLEDDRQSIFNLY